MRGGKILIVIPSRYLCFFLQHILSSHAHANTHSMQNKTCSAKITTYVGGCLWRHISHFETKKCLCLVGSIMQTDYFCI